MIVGLIWEEQIESFFGGKIMFVGCMLLITSLLLFLTIFAKKKEGSEVNYLQSFVIGIAQTIAILPGISRSGATIATALLLGVDKAKAARFSFLMVLLPIIGATTIKVKEIAEKPAEFSMDLLPLSIGFLAAFISGLLACKWMVNIVKRGKLVWFAVYCCIIGLIAVFYKLLF